MMTDEQRYRQITDMIDALPPAVAVSTAVAILFYAVKTHSKNGPRAIRRIADTLPEGYEEALAMEEYLPPPEGKKLGGGEFIKFDDEP
jgi:hypothetical protein